MQGLPVVLLGLLMTAASPAGPRCQSQGWSVAVPAVADGNSTEAGGYLLAIPGVDDDFVLFADGSFVVRANGTVRLSAYAQRLAAIDREFFVELEFSGRSGPGVAGYPPAGYPVLTLQANAYTPVGPVDPATFFYYTQVTGTLTGLRNYAGARLSAVNQGAAQLGIGATNKNVGFGLAVDLALTVLQQPTLGTLAPTGPAQLRANLASSLPMCLTHVDANTAVSSGPLRTAIVIPGLADDYVFLPVGSWTETTDGSATLSGTIRRQSDYSDEWTCSLSLSGRVDPGDAAHPPPGSPVLQLLPAAYSNQGGPVEPAHWRYYTQATGTLQGNGLNAGGVIQVANASTFQVGLGADQGNLFFGLAGELLATSIQQPTGHTLTVTGNLTVRANVATSCILPLPNVQNGVTQSIPNVTQQKVVYTGVDLGWCEQAAIGVSIVVHGMPRRWFEGNLRIVDHGTLELSIPQGLPVAVYPVRVLNPTGASNPLTLDVQAPALPTLRTENDRLAGEPQHWVVHQGNVQGFVFDFVLLSSSNLPSFAPGLVSLDIGNQFSDILILDVVVHDFVTGIAVVFVPAIPASLAGLRLYAQAAMMDSSFFPLIPSDMWFTDY